MFGRRTTAVSRVGDGEKAGGGEQPRGGPSSTRPPQVQQFVKPQRGFPPRADSSYRAQKGNPTEMVGGKVNLPGAAWVTSGPPPTSARGLGVAASTLPTPGELYSYHISPLNPSSCENLMKQVLFCCVHLMDKPEVKEVRSPSTFTQPVSDEGA